MTTRLKIAIQKSGRLYEGSVALLRDSGLTFSIGSEQLKTNVTNFPVEILLLRDDDIPQYVEDKIADIGIVGENVFREKSRNTRIIKRLGFAKCRLSVAIPRVEAYDNATFLNGKNIATSYPGIVRQFLQERNISAGIHEISGSVEIAPAIGLADAICDLVSSGNTLKSNGLKEVDVIMHSEAVVITSPVLEPTRQAILDRLIFRMEAVKNAKNNKYILLNCPNDAIERITQVIPGMKSPTILPLHDHGWSSLHSVVNENDFWEQIDELKSLGAQGILVIPIEKMIA